MKWPNKCTLLLLSSSLVFFKTKRENLKSHNRNLIWSKRVLNSGFRFTRDEKIDEVSKRLEAIEFNLDVVCINETVGSRDGPDAS